ncbi:hypothetical protein LCGC14_0767400, partial [marine sediment metagenome]
MALHIENLEVEDIKEKLDEINQEFEGKSPQEILKWVFNTFGEKVVLASSLGLEDQVLTHMSIKTFLKLHVFFLDTGRLNQETYDVLAESIEKYKIKYDIYFPRAEEVERFQGDFGPNAFYQSLELRHRCCQ